MIDVSVSQSRLHYAILSHGHLVHCFITSRSTGCEILCWYYSSVKSNSFVHLWSSLLAQNDARLQLQSDTTLYYIHPQWICRKTPLKKHQRMPDQIPTVLPISRNPEKIKTVTLLVFDWNQSWGTGAVQISQLGWGSNFSHCICVLLCLNLSQFNPPVSLDILILWFLNFISA